MARQGHTRGVLLGYVKRLVVQRRRREPMFEIKRISLREKNRILTPFRAHPKTILPAECVHVREDPARRDQLAVDPAVAHAAILILPGESVSTTVLTCFVRNATSSPKVAALICRPAPADSRSNRIVANGWIGDFMVSKGQFHASRVTEIPLRQGGLKTV